MRKSKSAPKKQRVRKASPDIPQLNSTGDFEALSDAEKERVWDYFDRKIPLSETRPLTDAEWAQEKKAKKKMGRPKIGQGAKLISVTVEKGLLSRADAYARTQGMKRAELIAVGLALALGEA
jgi:hypothetical protein